MCDGLVGASLRRQSFGSVTKPYCEALSDLYSYRSAVNSVHLACHQLLVCVVVLRRIAKLLLFCSLVPESVPPLPACGTAAYVRRLWQHPDALDVTCEV
jgi:hypothetical protein